MSKMNSQSASNAEQLENDPPRGKRIIESILSEIEEDARQPESGSGWREWSDAPLWDKGRWNDWPQWRQ